jgi:hypothetical protein
MKKIICLVVVVLMIAAVAIAAKKMVITEKNLFGLKGTWEGILSFGEFDWGTSPVKLEILNDSVPVKARLTISKVPDQLAIRLGASSGQQVLEFDDGTITSQGTLMWVGAAAKNFFEVSLSGEKKLGAWYYYRGMKGDATLKKK